MLEDEIDAPAPSAPAAAHAETEVQAAYLRLGAVASAAAALAACGGGGERVTPDPEPGRSVTLAPPGTYPPAANDEEAARFLLHAQFSAREADIVAVRAEGYIAWLERQIATPYVNGWYWLNYWGFDNAQDPGNYYDNSYPGDFMVWSQLMGGAAPVRARMALALSELFVVSLNGLTAPWPGHVIAQYWDTLMQHGLGNYRTLLEAVTLNPAMGYYLNTRGNLKENNAGRQPDENYAREVMQLFTIGLNMLNPDGTLQLDGAGQPIPTYGPADVSNLARVFTGYDLDMSQNHPTTVGTRVIPSTHYARLPMKLTPENHSTLAATFLGVTIPANTPADQALRVALDTLFNHPNTAPFVSKQLIQRLVTSNPSPGYVARVAAVFADNGAGVRGDLAFVLAAILLDEEARGPAGLADPQFGKLREPMVRLVQWARTFDVRSASGAWKIRGLGDAGYQLGQSPLRAPSVFNFFRPGYVPPKTGLGAGKVAPEFQLVNESSVGGYLNFMMGVIAYGLGDEPADMRASYHAQLPLAVQPSAANPMALINRLNLLLCAGQLSPATAATIAAAVGSMASASERNKRDRVCAAVLMVMACAEYLIQK